jgi:hypothetical protein
MRVNYNCPAAAAKARIHLHQTQFGENLINCYFAQVRQTCTLALQFIKDIISPPIPKKWCTRFNCIHDTSLLASLNTAASKEQRLN